MERVLKDSGVPGCSGQATGSAFLCDDAFPVPLAGLLRHAGPIRAHQRPSAWLRHTTAETLQWTHPLSGVFSLWKTRNTLTHKQYWFSYGSMTSLRGAERGQYNTHTTREHTHTHLQVKVSPDYLGTVWPTGQAQGQWTYIFVHFSSSSTVNIRVSLWLHEPIESNYQAPITPDEIAHCLGFVCFIRLLIGYVVETIRLKAEKRDACLT